ncbi:SDR family oxidoreductase [Sphingomonas oligophenolica]|uniref:SDR family oxidoreductase n=1 Tax=Sphingomonas oligophenolica TaxID=301154 RepID=A0ABU9Y959_9SPHN
MAEFNGKTILVVGAGGGIGSATALAFSRAGAHVTAAGRSSDRLDRAAAAANAEAAPLDFLDAAAVDAFFAKRGAFDHVVVAAAAVRPGSVASLSLEDAHAAMESKFWGAYRVARAAQINEGGSLTMVTGVLARRPNPANTLLGAINGGLEALVRGLALERAPVRVNAVSPGMIDTPLYGRMPEENRKAMFAATAARLPTQRIGQGEDVAAAILFVAGNPFVTGSTVMVDGGAAIA